jgi:hypothetical protein
MKLLNKANFDLAFDIKNLPELQRKIQRYENPIHLLELMYSEICMLNQKLAIAKQGLSEIGDPNFISPGDPEGRLKHANHMLERVNE